MVLQYLGFRQSPQGKSKFDAQFTSFTLSFDISLYFLATHEDIQKDLKDLLPGTFNGFHHIR